MALQEAISEHVGNGLKMTEWAKQQHKAREEDREEFQRKHAEFKKDKLDLEQILSGAAADKKQETETMESEIQIETRDSK